jgi:hypothetical protein
MANVAVLEPLSINVLKSELGLNCNHIAVFLLSCFLATVATNVEQPRQTEIDNLGLPLWRHQNVSGFQVSMNNAHFVCFFERRSHLPPQLHGLSFRQRHAGQPAGRRCPADVLHDGDVRLALRIELVDYADVGVIEPAQSRCFFADSSAGSLVGERAGRQDLDCHVALQTLVTCAIHFTHPTRADFFKDAVMTERLVNHEANPQLCRMLDALGMQVNVGVWRPAIPQRATRGEGNRWVRGRVTRY